MTIMLYDVHVIRENAKGRFFDLDDDFEQLRDGLRIVLNRWNDVQIRNEAQLMAKRETCEELRAMVETLASVIDKAEENS